MPLNTRMSHGALSGFFWYASAWSIGMALAEASMPAWWNWAIIRSATRDWVATSSEM